MEFLLEHSHRENRTTFSKIPLLPEFFNWNYPESRVLFTFQPDFPKTVWKWLTTKDIFNTNLL